jgi:predicted dehydrogenase
MKALVIGYGSIGSRHARILTELGCQVAVVSSRDIPVDRRFSGIGTALQEFCPEYVVIASETARHHADLAELAAGDFTGTVLVEKPLFKEARTIPENRFSRGYVAYNLRFHPLIMRLREVLAYEEILSVQAYVGQYLPTWRPDQDYRRCYSADRSAGGGALRDLSHELDYLNWLLGGWQSVTASGGHFSPLEITSDDLFALMLSTSRCPVVTVQLNYLDRQTRREIIVNTAEKTVGVDFVAGRLSVNKDAEGFRGERDDTYREMHAAILGNNDEAVCTLDEGIDVVNLIEAAESATREKRWISR